MALKCIGHCLQRRNSGSSIKRDNELLCKNIVDVNKEINNMLLQGKVPMKKLHDWVEEANAIVHETNVLLKLSSSSSPSSRLLRQPLIITHKKVIDVLKKCPLDHHGQRSARKIQKMEGYNITPPTTKAKQHSDILLSALEKSGEDKLKMAHIEQGEIEEIPYSGKNEMSAGNVTSVLPDQGTSSWSFSTEIEEMPSAINKTEAFVSSESASLSPTFKNESMSSKETTKTDDENHLQRKVEKSSVRSTKVVETISSFSETKGLGSIYTSQLLKERGLVSIQKSQGENISADEPNTVFERRIIAEIRLPRCLKTDLQDMFPSHYSIRGDDASNNDDPIYCDLLLEETIIKGGDVSLHGGWEEASVIIVLVDKYLSSLPNNPNCPELKILLLQRNNRLRNIHISFFEGMASLGVLDLSNTRIKSLPPSLFKLTQLKVLLLRECGCLDELPHEIGDLQSMEVLDLWGTELYQLPNEIKKLIRLKVLQVSFYGPDEQSEYANLPGELVSPDFVSNLIALQALSISTQPKDHRWSISAGPIINNLGLLYNLTYMDFYFPEIKFLKSFIQTSPSWRNGVLRKFKFVVGQNIKRIVSRVPHYLESDYYNHHDRCLKFVNGAGDNQNEVVQVLERATGFYLDNHHSVCSLWEFEIEHMTEMEFCLVRECPNMELLIDNEEGNESVLPSLRHLSIHYLWKLESIWKGPVTHGSLSQLKVLTVQACPKLDFILLPSMLPCLSKLEVLVVEDCASLKHIIQPENDNLVHDGVFPLPGLRILKLQYLPELVNVWDGDFPLLLQISIYSCPNLKNSRV